MTDKGLRQFDDIVDWRSLKNEKVVWLECNGHPTYLGKRCGIIYTAWAILGGPQGTIPTLVFEDEKGFFKQWLPNGPTVPCVNQYDEILLEVQQ